MKVCFLSFVCVLLLCSMSACAPQQIAVSSRPSFDDKVSDGLADGSQEHSFDTSYEEFSDSLSEGSQEFSFDSSYEEFELLSYQDFCKHYSLFLSKWEIDNHISSSTFDEHFCIDAPKVQIGKLVEISLGGISLDGDWYGVSRSHQVNAYYFTAEQLVDFTGISDSPFLPPGKTYYDFFSSDFQNSNDGQMYQISFCTLDDKTLLIGFCGNYYTATSAEDTLFQKFSYKDWLASYSCLEGHYSLSDVVVSAQLVDDNYNKWVELLATETISVLEHRISLSERQYVPMIEEKVRLYRYDKLELCQHLGYLNTDELPFLEEGCLLNCFELWLVEESGESPQIIYICPIDEKSFMIGVGGAFFIATKTENNHFIVP